MTTRHGASHESVPDQFETAIIEELGLVEVDALAADRAARVLLRPSFTQDVVVTVWARGPDAWLEVRALPRAGRRRALERCGVRSRPPVDGSDVDPTPRVIERPLDAQEFDELWGAS